MTAPRPRSTAQKRRRLLAVAALLKERYPEASCALEYGGDPWKLLVMGRLSAQCTDARVNLICRDLFALYPTPAAMAAADLAALEEAVRPCGLYRVKAADLRAASRMLCEEYGGVLPSDMEQLLAFPGVGRKIANLLRGDLFGISSVVTDTHCIRLCGRFGMYPETMRDPLRAERILTPLLEGENASDFCHRIVLFGREVCTARSPHCAACPIGEAGLCSHTPERPSEI